MKTLLKKIKLIELLKYGTVTAFSYLILYVGTYLLVEIFHVSPQISYLVLLSLVYVGVYISYTKFVFKERFTLGTFRRFVFSLILIWALNNVFFYILNDIFSVHYIIVITLNILLFGGLRFMFQRFYVFKGSYEKNGAITQSANNKQINEREPVALTFDLEMWHEGEWLQKYITDDIRNTDMLEESVYPLLDILDKNQAKATFFTTDLVVQKYPDLIKKIHDHGHEIGSHGFRHTRLESLSKTDFETLLTDHCERIKNIIGNYPKSFRAPHFSLNQSTKWVLPILYQKGFLVDSSIFPVQTSEYGISAAPLDPYRISFDNIVSVDSNSPITEIPATIISFMGIKVPVSGGIYFRIMPLWLFKILFNLAVNKRTLPSLYFHPHELCVGTPKIQGPFVKTTLKYWGVSRSLKKFENLLEHFTFDSITHILKQRS
jgi:polysaccharide deacetylase family protein (PEP-CTERM system associated)